MSSKKKRSRSSALSSPYVSRLPSTDRRLSRAAGTTAVAAERSDPARDMGLQPAGPDVQTSSVCWCGVATTNSLVAHVRTWNDCYGFGYTSGYCLRSLASFFGILARQGRVSAASMQWAVGDAFCRFLHGSGTFSGSGALACAHLSAERKSIEVIETE